MTRHLRLSVLAAAAFAAALGLSACGNGSASQTSSTPAPSPSTSSTSSSSHSAPPSSASPAPTTSGGTAGGPARCLSTQLSASLGPGGGGAAGHVYASIILTNTGSTPCLLSGFAGVSLTDGPNGGPIGAPADRDTTDPVVDIVLNPGKSGAAQFGYTQAGNYGASCTQVEAAGIRIYPPEDFGSLFIPEPRTACSEGGIHLLTLKAFQPM